MRLAIALVLVLPMVGCAPRENIPTYPQMSVADSLQVIRDRSSAIKSVSGEGAVTLTDSLGRDVRLDAAFVFSPPDRARVRAWKFGQAVLDLTITPEGTWLFLPRRDDRADQLRSASSEAGRAVRQWLALLVSGFDAKDAREAGSQLHVNPSPGVVAYIDRKTLTPRRYTADQFSLTLDQYRAIEGVVWPARIDAKSPGGTVRIDMREIELNAELPPTAFKPPARAERLP